MDLNELNSEQIEAVSSLEGHIRVIAGAGSGKTRALAYRFAFLVDEIGISPSNILCVTFTNKAANEMKRRIRKLIGDNDCGYVVTFHGLCVRILREDGHTIGYPKSFPILDDEDRDQILKDVYEESRLTLRDMNYKDAKRAIELFKNGAGERYYDYMISLSLDELYDKFKSAKNAKDKIIHGYIYYQRKMFGLDFNDLILLTMYIFSTYEAVLSKWQQRFQYIMVDEFQDVSTSQYEMVKLLSGYHNNLFIVGDPDQTIYSWRGAEVKYIVDFDKDFPDTKTIVLNKNYRSSTNILSVSNSLIRHNQYRYEKELVPIRSANVPVLYNHAKTTNLEADWIVEQIKHLLDSGKKLSDIAILYRAHYVSRPIEEKLLQAQLPYKIYSGTPFYGRREIKDVLAYLRLLLYKDDLSFKRVINTPKRNIGKARMKIIQDYAETNNTSMYEALCSLSNSDDFADTGAKDFISLFEYFETIQKEISLSDLVAQMIDKSGYEILLRTEGNQDRLDNIEELKRSIYSFESTFGEDVTLLDYLSVAALYSNDDLAQKGDFIKMMTIHSAKGLEFPFVFVCGLNEGIFPSARVKSIGDMEEERRLAYVAFTRAEQALFISEAEGLNYDNSYRFPSRFIFNIDKECLSYVVELEESLISDAKAVITHSEENMASNNKGNSDCEFAIGDHIVHELLGKGKVIEVNDKQCTCTIKFENLSTERTVKINGRLKKAET